ncbi:protein kinase domain-containing protein [Paracnuella aquatica]|uniref:protein kinase domain-containing protein n=1 Tax=Paracnuella aquatica TaxID=2268757 RepID=UPI000DEF41C8|nr:protein kinase [Paracnuella aquatica]RPD51552.1 serine/threonine protein kinase [Paracnuella aquatica]
MSKVFTITEGLENMGALKTGGQGSVYKARRIGPIITAVKLLPTPIHTESEEDRHYRDFQNEVAKLKRANAQPNPNVVKFLSSGITESGSLPFIEMEFIEGPDLEELLHPPHDPVFSIKEIMKVADHLSNALAHCHRLDIRHGDIKSNNVKFNIHTGNYVLLDFGLAIMSDEQRRTSLRHAGAIEFMAPEQNEGRMLPQTDIYSFGIILYELIAGRVPFPLTGGTESARNEVRLQHMETPPPDPMQLRQDALPQNWSSEKQAREMAVPSWLLHLVEQCLQKRPEDRFASGMELHDFVAQHMVQSTQKAAAVGAQQDPFAALENERLKNELAILQKTLQQQRELAAAKESELVNLRVALTRKDRELAEQRERQPAYAAPPPLTPAAPVGKRSSGMKLPMILVAVFLAAALLYLAGNNLFGNNERITERERPAKKVSEPAPEPRRVIGEYKVVSERAYFHNEADQATRRSAYMIPSEEIIKGLEEKNGFIYVEFTNNRNQTSKGWLLREDLMPLSEWLQQQAEQQRPMTKIEINQQLQEAKAFINTNNRDAAFAIYRKLAEQDVPEAMYEWGNRALKSEHEQLNCDEGFDLVRRAAENDYTPAKRTLGFLYLFGQNKDVLRMSNYQRCTFERNVVRGTRLLVQAATEGDSTANRILNDFNNQNDETDSSEEGQ